MSYSAMTVTETLARMSRGSTLRRRVDRRYVLERDGGFDGQVPPSVIVAMVQKGWVRGEKGNVFGTVKYYLTNAGRAYINHIEQLRAAHRRPDKRSTF